MARKKSKRGKGRKTSRRRVSGFGLSTKGYGKYVAPLLGIAGGLALGQVVSNQLAKQTQLADKPLVRNIIQGGGGVALAVAGKGGAMTYVGLGLGASAALNQAKTSIPGLGSLTEGDISDIMNGITVGAMPISVGGIQTGDETNGEGSI